jgi:carboxypeptidase family protein
MRVPGGQVDRLLRRVVAGAVVLPATAWGQSIRGVVTDRVSSAPAYSAIVTLERVRAGEPGVEIRSVLVDERGAFALSAPSGGTFAVLVRRIGSRPFRSDTMTLGTGEVKRLDIVLDPVRPDVSNAFTLDRVTVSSATPCRTATDQSIRIADLWDNARTALLATAISTRDSLVKRRMVRYERARDAATLAIKSERVRAFDAFGGAGGGFFRSISAESLSKLGYWQRNGTGSARFHGPDENALLSTEFLADHCFTLVEPDSTRAELLGLGFEPAEDRRGGDAPPEIRGTIWLNRKTSELRFLEFDWVSLPPGIPQLPLGGYVRFARLPWGPWFVQNWWLRMPEGLTVERNSTSGRFGVLEEGGFVQMADVVQTGMRPARLTGVLRDPESNPLAGALISISETRLRTITNREGRFTLDSVPPGLQVLIAEHPDYESFGVPAAKVDLLLEEGQPRDLIINAASAAEIPIRLCGDSLSNGSGVLRLTVVDGRTKKPIAGLRVTLAQREAKVSGIGYVARQVTDERGVSLFCGAPAETLLVVTTAFDERAPAFELALPASGMKSRVLQLGGK